MQSGRVLRGRAVRLGDVGDADRAEEHHHHRPVDREPLAAVAGHAAVGEDERRRDHEHEQHLEEVGELSRVLERVRGVRVEEPAAVGAEQLDRLLRGDRPHPDRLRQPGDRVDGEVVGEVRDHPLGDEHERRDHRQRREHVEDRAHEVLPEIAEALAAAPDDPADSATATTIPIPADSQFWTVSPSIWLR